MAIVETYKGPAIEFGLLMKKKVVVFDLDGVLVDSTKLMSDFFLATYPSLTQKKFKELLMGNFPTEIEKFSKENKSIDETPEQREKRALEYSARKTDIILYPGIQKMLEVLNSEQYTLVINTSALKRNCAPPLEKAGVLHLFDFLATKDLSISKVDKFKIISEKYGVKPEEMVFITDTLGDLREASEVNVPTIAVTWGVHDASYFTREPHKNLVKIVDSIDNLLVTIKSV